jgi:hypothetical protein
VQIDICLYTCILQVQSSSCTSQSCILPCQLWEEQLTIAISFYLSSSFSKYCSHVFELVVEYFRVVFEVFGTWKLGIQCWNYVALFVIRQGTMPCYTYWGIIDIGMIIRVVKICNIVLFVSSRSLRLLFLLFKFDNLMYILK